MTEWAGKGERERGERGGGRERGGGGLVGVTAGWRGAEWDHVKLILTLC